MKEKLFLSIFFFFGYSVLHGFLVTEPEPLIGPAGSQILVKGADFDEQATYTVMMDDMELTVNSVSEAALMVAIPEGAETAYLTVSDGAQTFRTTLAFMVTKEITVTYATNLGMDVSSYDMGTLYSTAEEEDSHFKLQIDTFNHSLVMADNEEGSGSPVYGIGRVDKDSLELGAASTVEAMALMSGILHSPDYEELSNRLDFLTTLSEYLELVQLVQGAFDEGTDFLDASPFDTGLKALLEAFVEAYVPDTIPSTDEPPLSENQNDIGYDFGLGFYNFRRNYPRDLENTGYEGIDRVIPIPGVKVSGRRGTVEQKIKMDSAPIKSSAFGETIGPYLKGLKGNPLDWSANLYELDINDPALFTPQLADGITESFWNYAYDRVTNEALDRIIVPAVLVSSYGDIEAQLVAGIKDQFIPQFLKSVAPEAEPTKLKEELIIPSELPAIFMIRTFSGASFPEQAELIAALPGGEREAFRMMFLNIVMAANDGLGILIGQSNTINGKEWAKFLASLEMNILATWERQTAQGTLTQEALLGIVWETRKAVISFLVDKARDKVLDTVTDLFRGRFGRVAKAVKSGVSVTGKVSSAFSIVERLSALTNAPRFIGPAFENARMAFALEDTLVVVGNPWAPIIESFEPIRAYQGQEISLYGDGFSPDIDDNMVTFGYASTDSEDPREEQQAEIVSATVTSLQVKIPVDAVTGPIVAEVKDAGTGSTAPNDAPYDKFTIIPDPVITEVFPETPVGGTPIRIFGTNFPTDPKIKFRLMFEGEFFESVPRVVSSTEMYVTVPASGGETSISMKMFERSIGAFPIEILEPPTPPNGLEITVTTTADGNVRDEDITLREAILLARGELSVGDLTSPPAERPPGVNYETDFVFNDQIGPASRARIAYSLADPIVLSSPLPSISNFDSLENLRIDGSGVTGQPLILDGTEGASLSFIRVFSSSQDGILLTGGATRNTGTLIIEDPSRHGVHFEENAFGNQFTVSVKNPGENGLHLSGAGVFGNEVLSGNEVGIIGPGNWGIVVENGASFNQFAAKPGSLADGYHISGFSEGGIWIQGEASAGNIIGFSEFGGNVQFPIHSNGGPGLVVEGARTILERLNLYGNEGHGIEFRPGSSYSSVYYSRIGYESATGNANANQGSGIYFAPGSKDVLIGNGTDGQENAANSIGGNRDHGIFMEGPGVENISINATTIGTVYFQEQNVASLANGEHGIALMNGVSGAKIGDGSSVFGTHITNHTEGAGIYLHGNQTSGNTIKGVTVGATDVLAKINLGSDEGGNAVGIHITGGAYGNLVGVPGERVLRVFPEEGFLTPYNEIFYNDIGILIESGGDPSQTVPNDPFVPYSPNGANVLVNNRIGDEGKGNGIGIKLTSGANANRIGGPKEFEANWIVDNQMAGIYIDGVTHTRPERANRIIGNTISGTGKSLGVVADARTGVIQGAGIHIVNGASNQIIGGLLPGEKNTINAGIIGVAIENCDGNVIIGNEIGGYTISGFPSSTFLQNQQAGVLIYQSSNNRIGPRNNISGNGLQNGPALGGIYIQEGERNRIIGNVLGTRPLDVGGSRLNNPAGITLDNSSNNQIGFRSPDGINEIGRNNGLGIHIFGNGSTRNRVENNLIGTNLLSQANPNTLGGVLIEDGAKDNVLEKNTIIGNGGPGVQIDGADTIRNTISINSITDHDANPGISLTNSGNAGILPPLMESSDGFNIMGTVPIGTPDKSIVEFFADPGLEGETFIGSTEVKDEKFEFTVLLTPSYQLTSTLTDTDGNTSEFSPVYGFSPIPENTNLFVQRSSGEPEASSVPVNLSPFPVMPIQLTAPEDFSVLVESLSFASSGTVDEAVGLDGVALYRDEDGDGKLSGIDSLLSEVTAIPSDDGEVEVQTDAFIEEGETEQWLLAVFPSQLALVGSTVHFQLESSQKVASGMHFSGTPITASGVYPVLGDTITLLEAATAYSIWRAQTFSPEDAANEEISGLNADPDKDGIPNLLEFALGTNPNEPDEWNDALISVTDDAYVFRFPADEDIIAPETVAEVTNDLVTWNSGSEFAEIVGNLPDEETGEFFLVVRVPRPVDESIPVFVRLVYQTGEG